jgi:hypothetical protein
MKRLAVIAGALLALALLATGALYVRGLHEPADSAALVSDAGGGLDLVARGRYLALAGNCMACHTVRGGQAFAGGRAIETPFGRIYGSNLTPDPTHGIGAWSAYNWNGNCYRRRSSNCFIYSPSKQWWFSNYIIYSNIKSRRYNRNIITSWFRNNYSYWINHQYCLHIYCDRN